MPQRLTAQDFDPQLLVLFDAYVHGDLDRRGFLDKARGFAKAGITAAGLLAALSPGPLLVHLAANNARINAAWPAYEPDAAAAKLAWDRTVAFFKQHLA